MKRVALQVAELDGRLHDAEVDIESIRLEGRVLLLCGQLFELDHRKTVKRAFSLRIGEVDGYDLFDDAMVGILPVEEVAHTSGRLLFRGAIPVWLRVRTGAVMCELLID